ncbi:MAG TPA: hypothetical protein VMW10_06100 [Alphaproteobacteria bacterium]|nr:hypothetical protein [Alphaproteobacteria bacterium]
MKKYKFIYIEWQDAFSNGTWFKESELKEWFDAEMFVKQTGWVIHEDKKRIVIATRMSWDSYSEEWHYGLLQNIPKTWIKKRRNLTKAIEQ